MEIDKDGNISEEMARTLLREHQGIEFTNETPWYLQPQRPLQERSRSARKSRQRRSHSA